MKAYWAQHNTTLYHGDNLVVMPALAPDSIDTIITDPPYGLGFMGKDWDSPGGTGNFPMRRTNEQNTVNTGASRQGGRQRGCADWAKRQAREMQSFQEWTTQWAIEALRVAKPGAFLLAFGGTRTYHRLACAIEDAGWEIRDCLMWLYGQGFPKSINFGCKCQGNSLSYGHEKKPESEAEYDVRSVQVPDVPPAINADDECREVLFTSVSQQGTPAHGDALSSKVGNGKEQPFVAGRELHRTREGLPNDSDARASTGEGKRLCAGTHIGGGKDSRTPSRAGRGSSSQKRETGRQSTEQPQSVHGSQLALDSEPHEGGGRCPTCGGVKEFAGYGSALKPSWEPIIVAMKPLDGTFAANAVKHGVAGLNIDGGRIEHNGRRSPCKADGTVSRNSKGVLNGGHKDSPFWNTNRGRWPANVLLDEVAAAQIDLQSGTLTSGKPAGVKAGGQLNCYGHFAGGIPVTGIGDSGGASRFFKVVRPDVCCVLCNLPLNDAECIILEQCKPKNASCAEPKFQNERGDSVLGRAQQNGRQINEGSKARSKANAASAENHSRITEAIPECSVQRNANPIRIEKLALCAKSAADLCDSCATLIAQSLAAINLGQDAESILGKASIAERKKQILTYNLARFAANPEATDTTATILGLRKLLGCVQSATDNIIPGLTTASCPSRFHYSSKASRSERNDGCDDLVPRPIAESESRNHSLNSAMRMESGVATGPKANSSKSPNHHPTVKPLALMEYLCKLTATPTGGTVLDPFLGSGTTALAVSNTGRKFIGIELSEEYIKIAVSRFTQGPLFTPAESRSA